MIEGNKNEKKDNKNIKYAKGMKTWMEILVTPLVVAVLGVVALLLVSKYERENVARIAEVQRATSVEIVQAQTATSRSIADAQQADEKAMRQIRIMEVFLDKMTSRDLEAQKTALKLSSLLDPELATMLLTTLAIADPEETKEIRDLAEKEIERRLLLSVAAEEYVMGLGLETTINIRVVDGNGNPVEDALVTISAKSGGFSETPAGSTNEEGEFTIHWTAPSDVLEGYFGYNAKYYSRYYMGEHYLHVAASKDCYVSTTADIKMEVRGSIDY